MFSKFYDFRGLILVGIAVVVYWLFIAFALGLIDKIGNSSQMPLERQRIEITAIAEGNSILPISPVVYVKPQILASIISGKKAFGIFSAYNATEAQCDSTPFITASGQRVREGIVANNCLPFGTKIKMDGKILEVQDRMNKRYDCEYFDLFMWSYQDAKNFGKQIKEVIIYQ